MCDGKDGAEQDANTTNGDVCDAQERVTAADHGTSGNDDGLCALVRTRWESCVTR